MANNGLMTGTAFQAPPDRPHGVGAWQHRRPVEAAAKKAPAATPAAPAAQDLLERVAETRHLADDQLGAFEAALNLQIGSVGARQAAGVAEGWQRPAATPPGDLSDLAQRMGAAREKLASGGRRSGVVGVAGQDAPTPADLAGMEAQLAALIRQDPRERQPAPENGSLAERVRGLEERSERAQGGEVTPEESFKLDGEIGEIFGELDAEVQAASAAADVFELSGPRPVEVDEALFARAAANPRGLSQAEAGQFEAMLNAQVDVLGRNPELTRPALPEPAPAKPAAQSGDALAAVDPMVLLAALEKLGVDQEILAGLVAGEDEGGAGDGA